MPRLTTVKEPETTGAPTVEFVLSEALDLMNSMYFTHLVVDSEGVEGWPVEVRKEMAPDLLKELDTLFSLPIEQPGLAGTLADHLWEYRETWKSVDALLDFVRNMPLGVSDAQGNIGVQALFFNTSCGEEQDKHGDGNVPTRDHLAARVKEAGGDVKAILALWDDPESVRERLVTMIERFYNEHYKAQWPERLGCLERSVAAHRGTNIENVIPVMKGVLNRDAICLENSCSGPFRQLLFAPSVDMGPWASCAVLPQVHGMFYPCETRFINGNDDAEEMIRIARIHKALGDEQRLRMLEMLRGREMYAQEIVDRMGLHQSVVSRHLSFLKVVGLLEVRKQNNMKFYSLSPQASRYLQKTIDMFPAQTTKGGPR